MKAKEAASAFRRKYSLKAINSAVLAETLSLQGYTIVEFSADGSNADAAELLSELRLTEQSRCSRCFTYRSESCRLVFLQEELNDEERTVALAHEQGHILLGHMEKANVFGDDILQEYEANEFAHYLLKDKTGAKRRRLIIALASALLIAVIGIAAALIVHFGKAPSAAEEVSAAEQTVEYTEFYRTPAGSKYHTKDCRYIKDKPEAVFLTKAELESGSYTPCGVCRPDEAGSAGSKNE